MKTRIIKDIQNESCEIDIDVRPKYVKTKPSAILLNILLTMELSSLAWKDKL